jgi:uncharacterized C2H2 Zn-finger protein
LPLSQEDQEHVLECPNSKCDGVYFEIVELQLVDNRYLDEIYAFPRSLGSKNVLRCSKCNRIYTREEFNNE